MSDEQLPLFPVPDGWVIPSMRRRPADPDKARYARFRPMRRTLCGDCIRDIHERGIAVAPLPRPVSWKRVAGAEVDLLCDLHFRQRIGG